MHTLALVSSQSPHSQYVRAPQVQALFDTFGAALDAARTHGAAPGAQVSHLVPLLRLTAKHGPSSELAAYLRALFAVPEPERDLAELVTRLAASLAATGHHLAARRLTMLSDPARRLATRSRQKYWTARTSTR